MADSKAIFVYFDLLKETPPELMGRLYVDVVRGKEILSFEYASNWLSSGFAQTLDPDLHFFRGRQYPESGKPSFGMFLDSAPDRWGRMLMQRRERLQAVRDRRPVKPLYDTDYLLGVHDLSRMGALRFKADESGSFLAPDSPEACPPWTMLRTLEEAARGIDGSTRSGCSGRNTGSRSEIGTVF